MTAVIVSAAQEAAPQAIEPAEVVRLSIADQTCVAYALLTSPPPSPALERAFSRHRQLLRSE